MEDCVITDGILSHIRLRHSAFIKPNVFHDHMIPFLSKNGSSIYFIKRSLHVFERYRVI